MNILFDYIKRNWGQPLQCAHCNETPTALCGGCMEYAYCGSNCQMAHWKSHALQCINGGAGEKREREDEEIEDTRDLKKAVVELPEVKLGDLTSDIWIYISKFLNAKDLKNLNSMQMDLHRKMRRLFFSKFRFRLENDVIKDAYFKEIRNSISAVRVFSMAGIKAISFKKDNHITDVAVGPFFTASTKLIHWPEQITRLIIEYPFYGLVALPTQLKVLILKKQVQKITNIPLTLEAIEFHFDAPLEMTTTIPLNSLKRFALYGSYWNYPIDFLSNATQLKELVLMGSFNNSIDAIPTTIERLHLSYKFNQSTARLAQLTQLKVLHFGDIYYGPDFRQSLENLPPSLEELQLGQDLPLPNLPKLKVLRFKTSLQINVENIPPSVTHLDLSLVSSPIPYLRLLHRNFTELTLPFHLKSLGEVVFPPSLKRLNLHKHTYNILRDLNLLPAGVVFHFYS